MRFFIPIKRNPNALPPVISLVRGLASLGHEIHLFSYYHSPQIADLLRSPRVKITQVSPVPYPKGFVARAWSTANAHAVFWRTMMEMGPCDYVWLACWDYIGVRLFLKMRPNSPRLIYHFHEYEPSRFALCRAADAVIVPEENRSWITYVMARLRTRPLVLPNIPFDHPRRCTKPTPSALQELRREGRLTVLYQGHCDIRERCLVELLTAVSLADPCLALCIMPARDLDSSTKAQLDGLIASLGIGERVRFMPSMEAPSHLEVVGQADIGIGLYRPTDLNLIYCAPNRLYEFTGFGIPVILPATPAMEQIAARYQGIILCDPTSPRSIAEAMNQMAHPDAHRFARQEAHRFFEQHGSYIEALRQVLAQLAERASA